MRNYTLRLSEELDARIDQLAADTKSPKSDIIRQALVEYLGRSDTSPEPSYLNGRMHEIIEFIFSCTYHQSQQQHGRDFIEQMLDEAIANRKKFHDR